MLAIRHFPRILHRVVNHLIDLHPRLIVWGYHERPFGLFHIVVRDGGHPLVAVEHFVHAALRIELFHRLFDLASREFFHYVPERRVFLPHDLVQPRGRDPRFLELVIRSARFNGFMLACVAYQQYAVVFL